MCAGGNQQVPHVCIISFMLFTATEQQKPTGLGGAAFIRRMGQEKFCASLLCSEPCLKICELASGFSQRRLMTAIPGMGINYYSVSFDIKQSPGF